MLNFGLRNMPDKACVPCSPDNHVSCHHRQNGIDAIKYRWADTGHALIGENN